MEIENEIPKSRVTIRVERLGKYKKPIKFKKIKKEKVIKEKAEIISYGYYNFKSKMLISSLILLLTILSYLASISFAVDHISFAIFILILMAIPITLALLKKYTIAKIISIIMLSFLIFIFNFEAIEIVNMMNSDYNYGYINYGNEFHTEEYITAIGLLYFVLILFMKLTSRDYRLSITKKFTYLLILILFLTMAGFIFIDTPEITIFAHIGFVFLTVILNLVHSMTNKRKVH